MDFARLCSPGLRNLNLGLQARHLELFPTSYVASYNECRLYCVCTARQCKPMDRYFAECSIINPTFIGFAEASRYWSVQFFSAFYWPNSIGRPIFCQDYGVIQSFIGQRQTGNLVMTMVFLVKTTESYVGTTESYEVCRLGHHMDNTFTGKDQNRPNCRIGPDSAGRLQLQ